MSDTEESDGGIGYTTGRCDVCDNTEALKVVPLGTRQNDPLDLRICRVCHERVAKYYQTEVKDDDPAELSDSEAIDELGGGAATSPIDDDDLFTDGGVDRSGDGTERGEDASFDVRQRSLTGGQPDGQVTLDGDVVREGVDDTQQARDARAAVYAAVQATAEYYADHPPESNDA